MAKDGVYKLKLETIAAGGDALGRIEGKPVFVERGAPDEIVVCRVTEDHNTWARAELLEITEPSPVRTDSACRFYGKCGGCNLQHIEYEAQLELKVNILKDSLLRIGGIQAPEPKVFPSPPWEYRNRMQFHCFREKASGKNRSSYVISKSEKINFGLMGRTYCGEVSRAGAEIIPVTDCPIAVAPIREILRGGGKGITPPPEKDRFTVFCKDETFLNEGGQQRGRIKLLDKEIAVDAGMFFQSNCVMLEKLIVNLRKIAETADLSLPMADLYSGVGTFALFLGGLFPKVILAEENKNAVSLARETLLQEARENLRGVNAEFFALRDTEWHKTVIKEQRTENRERKAGAFGFAVVDPPRAGLAPKLAEALARGGTPVLAYVSCDAASLARDSKILLKGGYKLAELTLFDFYPQTAHIESLAVFTR